MEVKTLSSRLKIVWAEINKLKPSTYNPRRWSKEQIVQLMESLKRFGVVDPIIINMAPGREWIVIGGHMRLAALKALGYKTVPVVHVYIREIEREKELNLRLNKNTGEFDWDLLATFGEAMLKDIGFNSEDLDDIFGIDENPEVFDLQKELAKLDIKKITVQKGDIYELGVHRLMCGDSTVEEDILKLMNGEKADICFTDPPYILDYTKGKKKHGKATEGFGYKRDRKYMETDFLPDNFTELWTTNIHAVQKQDFHIIIFENWKNLRIIWGEMEKYWKVKNMIVWRLPNRTQGFAAKYKFFSKHDIAMVGGSGKKMLQFNLDREGDELQSEYETALYAISGKPHWEGYEKGKKICPTDFIDYKASDEKSSGQGIIFGTKPIEILIPYIKVLTKRGDIVIEPFGGSGSTLIACEKMKRRCFLMEKVPTYTQVIIARWQRLTGLRAKKISI